MTGRIGNAMARIDAVLAEKPVVVDPAQWRILPRPTAERDGYLRPPLRAQVRKADRVILSTWSGRRWAHTSGWDWDITTGCGRFIEGGHAGTQPLALAAACERLREMYAERSP